MEVENELISESGFLAQVMWMGVVCCMFHYLDTQENALPLSYLSWAKDNCPVCRLRNQVVTNLAKGNSHYLRVMQSKHAKKVSHLSNFQGTTTFLP